MYSTFYSRVDNNTKLMLSIEIFQNGHNEELVKVKFYFLIIDRNLLI
jgi:hypothetical protein